MAATAAGFTWSRTLCSSSRERRLLVEGEGAGEALVDVVEVGHHRGGDAGEPEVGERGVGPPSVRRARHPLDEAGTGQPVDGPGQTAGGEAGLGREVAHPQVMAG